LGTTRFTAAVYLVILYTFLTTFTQQSTLLWSTELIRGEERGGEVDQGEESEE